MTLTDFQKRAYTAGANQALTEVGLANIHPPGLSGEDVDESRMAISRIDMPGAPHPDDFVSGSMALRGGVGGLAGGALGGLLGLSHSLLSGRGDEAIYDWGPAGKSALLGALLGGGAGLVSGYGSGGKLRDQYEVYAAGRAQAGKAPESAALREEFEEMAKLREGLDHYRPIYK